MQVMARPSLLSLAVVGFCLLVLVLEPDRAYGSSPGSFGRNNGAPTREVDGICAIALTIHGYKCQEHEVKTEDGYILSMQRITEGRIPGISSTGGKKKQPVLIQHGNTADGMQWLLNSPNQNLPMILADKGFDVWIANSRGTRFSRKHVSLDPAQPEFWNWSWDELVSYDLPAFFDFVFKNTRQKIHYIGHSVGTLIGLASFSEGNQADTLKSAVFLSPIAYLSHVTSPLAAVGARAFVGEIATSFGALEFNPKGRLASVFLKSLCNYPGVDCYDLMTVVTGKNCCLNSSTVDLAIQYMPQSTSTKNMVHLAQTFRDGVIAKYDYGRPDYNMKHYGNAEPPIYNISNIPHDLPVFIGYGGQDSLADVRDVQLLLDDLKFHDVNKLAIRYIKDYAHLDFVMGVNAKDIVYNQIVQFFQIQE